MSFQKFCKKSCGLLFLVLFSLVIVGIAQVKKPTQQQPSQLLGKSELVVNQQYKEAPIAGSNNLYCAGYIQRAPVDTSNKIVGAWNEQEQFIYGQNNYLYVSAGANKGVKVGDMFAVVRPRGRFKSKFSRKDDLGIYMQEVGAVEVIKVQNEVSVVQVKTSCDNFLLSDLLQPVPQRVSPIFRQKPMLDLFADPSGKATGRIVMARDGQEMLGREQIVYIDLGSEDNVQIGDYMTIFRPLGRGGLFISDEDENLEARDEGFESRVFRGGKFSNQAPRKSGSEARGDIVTTEEAKEDRPNNLRKVVGELVIINVRERTATAVITRTAQEIHTGDRVELQ